LFVGLPKLSKPFSLSSGTIFCLPSNFPITWLCSSAIVPITPALVLLAGDLVFIKM